MASYVCTIATDRALSVYRLTNILVVPTRSKLISELIRHLWAATVALSKDFLRQPRGYCGSTTASSSSFDCGASGHQVDLPSSFKMAAYLEQAYSLVHQGNTSDQPTLQELKTQLEKGSDDTKMETMKRILTIMLNGDPMPQLLMHIIRFIMPSKNKPLKKLLYFYYEICPKLDSSGKLKQEMILVWYSLPPPTSRTSIETHLGTQQWHPERSTASQ